MKILSALFIAFILRSQAELVAPDGEDIVEDCCWWAMNDECSENPYWMRVMCQKSCGTHGCTVGTAENCVENINLEGCPWKFPQPLRKEADEEQLVESSIALDGIAHENPLDEGPSSVKEVECPEIEAVEAEEGCEIEDVVENGCLLQRLVCPNQISEDATGEGTKCRNQHFLCRFWGSVGECTKNPDYMLLFCPKACMQC